MDVQGFIFTTKITNVCGRCCKVYAVYMSLSRLGSPLVSMQILGNAQITLVIPDYIQSMGKIIVLSIRIVVFSVYSFSHQSLHNPAKLSMFLFVCVASRYVRACSPA